MSEVVTLTAVYEPVEQGWVQARLQELPGVITVAATRAEAKAMLLDALKEYLLALGREDEIVISNDHVSRERVELRLTG